MAEFLHEEALSPVKLLGGSYTEAAKGWRPCLLKLRRALRTLMRLRSGSGAGSDGKPRGGSKMPRESRVVCGDHEIKGSKSASPPKTAHGF